MSSPHDYYCYENFAEMLNIFETDYSYTDTSETVLSILYTLVGIAAVAGNICALYFFIRIDSGKNVRFTASRIFYSAFAASDLLTGVVSCWSALVFGKGRPFYFCSVLALSKPVNDLVGTLSNLTMFGGANIVSLMTVSRCVGVFLPFSYKHIFTPVVSCLLLGVVLLHPLIISLLPFFVPNYGGSKYDYTFNYVSGQMIYQFQSITNETNQEDVTPQADLLNIFLSFIPRLGAVVIMVACSGAVALKLLLCSPPIRSNDARKNAQRSASITLLVLAVIFFITYTPFCFLIIIDIAGKNNVIFTPKELFYFVPSCYLAAYVSSAVNPLVYHLRGRSIFESNKRKATIYSNKTQREATRVSVVEESKL